MKLTMPGFSQARILVVGDVMLDRYWHGGTSRISPEAPVPIVKVEQSEDRPGGAGNVALNITALGAAASLVGITGKDEAAESLEASLTAVGVNCDFSQSPDQPTITKLRVISRHQQLLRMDFEEAFGMECSLAIQNKVSESIGDHDAMVLSDYAKGVLHDPQPMIKAANAANIPVLVDPKGSDFERYRGATLLTPNLSEFEAVVGPCEHEQDLVDKGEVLMERLDLQALLITRGEHGMTLLRPGKEEFHLPARAREVFDVTGAGDTVISVVAAALAAGEALPQARRFG